MWGLLRKVGLSSRIRKSPEETGAWEEQNGGLGWLGLGIPGLMVGRVGGPQREGAKGQEKGPEHTWAERPGGTGLSKDKTPYSLLGQEEAGGAPS